MTKTILLWVVLILRTSEVSYGGAIKGSVTDSNTGILLPGTRIHLYTTGNDSSSRVFESTGGTFTIVGVPPGNYSCFVSKRGYRSMLATNVRVGASGTVMLEYCLKICTSPADSTDVDIYTDSSKTNDRMQYYFPDDKDYK
jgi:hypothetical protein